ncbi:hypothetical protein A0H81_09238 [Grifola frondosa]|uniref:Uncharacterized protein n=1 Tax=Grifola frondosa TaxID=5627 RepID=A0A1C7M101_GRIFR|nr:hypothetical protein A0H81_09238 [Grifola frondosa]
MQRNFQRRRRLRYSIPPYFKNGTYLTEISSNGGSVHNIHSSGDAAVRGRPIAKILIRALRSRSTRSLSIFCTHAWFV